MRKFTAIPQGSVSKLSGKVFYEQVVIRNESGWIEAVVHMDMFYQNGDDLYERLDKGETVEFTITPC